MKTLIYSLLALACLLAPTTVRANDVPDKGLRDRAVSWVIAHANKGPDSGLVKSLTKDIDEALDRGDNLSLLFGSGLTKSGKVEQMCMFAGQLFSVEFGDAQGRQANVNRMQVEIHGAKPPDTTSDTRVAQFRDLKIDNAGNFDGTRRITGSVSCKTLNPTEKKLAVRLSFQYGKSTCTGYVYLQKSLPEDGEVKFSFGAINPPDAEEKVSGPLVVFVDLCDAETEADQPKTVYSNAVGAIINVSNP